MELYRWEHPEALYILALVPALWLIHILWAQWRKRARAQFGTGKAAEQLSTNATQSRHVFKTLWFTLGVACLIIALANPQVGSKLETVKRKGVDVVFALDVSKSMLAEDVAPNRIEKSKQIIGKTLDALGSDRIGLVVYAGQAYPQLPITTDYSAARMLLRTVNTDIVPSQGTAISEAIGLADQYFSSGETTKNKVLFILSDGEDHEEGAAEAAAAALEKGIFIYTIGIGSVSGGPIPEKSGGVTIDFKKDQSGRVVVTKLDREKLMAIAKSGGGSYIYGDRTEEVVEYIEETLNSMQREEIESKVFSEYKDQFPLFLVMSLFCFLIDTLLTERKSWWNRLKLFNE